MLRARLVVMDEIIAEARPLYKGASTPLRCGDAMFLVPCHPERISRDFR